MRAVRPAAVAGTFYPAEPELLRRQVEGHLAAAQPAVDDGPVKAVIAPHAGYVYSGPIAGSAFAALRDAAPEVRRVVLLGPAHYVPVDGLALPGAASFETPLGRVEVDVEAVAEAAALPQVTTAPAAHAPEHALEVELPFLQVLLDDFRLVPLLVGRARPEVVEDVLAALWGGPETRIVISSDLSHYLGYEEARAVDAATAEAILALDGPLAPDRACGAGPINGLLRRARRLGLTPELVDLRNSADTAGDPLRVVGYGAFAFREAA